MRCIVVTPERAVLDETVEFVALPMYDGELGVMPGRAPLIGRLGHGELRLHVVVPGGGRAANHDGTTGELRTHPAERTERFFVDGGFAQVRADVVTVLTQRAIPAGEIDVAAARQQLEAAAHSHAHTAGEQAVREKIEASARAQIRVAEKQTHS